MCTDNCLTSYVQCKSLAPEYEKLGKTFEKEKDVIIAQINADKHRSLGKQFNVQGFPTLKWIQKGSSMDKAEDVHARSAEELVTFVNKKTGLNKKIEKEETAILELDDQSFASIALDPSRNALVGFFAPW